MSSQPSDINFTIGTQPANDGPLETAILFVDLISSSEFASVLSLREYAAYVDSFEDLCRRQCRYFFETFLRGTYVLGEHYGMSFLGDELVVYMHTGRPANDVYQLLSLAAALKCGWLGTPANAERVAAGAPTAELAAGVHIGTVWARRNEGGGDLVRRGVTINVAKRVESASRDGEHFRIFVSDNAFKRVNRRIRHIVFSPRRILPMKGVVLPVAVREVRDSFLDSIKRLDPRLVSGFQRVARQALASNSFDLWIHSCLQVSEEARRERVSDDCFEMCRHILNIDPQNPVALYYAAQGWRERDQPESALLFLEDLTRHWPGFADGWLELARLLKGFGDKDAARRALLQARRHGVADEEEPLPPKT